MPGQFYDAESSLFYNWNRYYNPATGRYISSDPIGLEGGINTFLYAAASPVMMIDPTGELVIALAPLMGSLSLPSAASIASAGVFLADAFATATAGFILMNKWVDSQEAKSEYEAYKTRASQIPPPDLDECAKLRWLLEREEDVVKAMKAWDAKWSPGRHVAAITQRQ